MKENLMVIFGGKSVEHDISIITALQIMKCVDERYNVVPVYIQRDGKWCTAKNLCEVDTFINFEKNVREKKEIVLGNGEPYLYIKKFSSYKKWKKIDAVLSCLHGGAGEDGRVSGLFSMCKIPCTSSNHTSSAICMDKIFTKQVLSSENILNVQYCSFTKKEFEESQSAVAQKIKKLGYPVIIKPANLGSSVAIEVVRSEKELLEKVKLALEFDYRILVEKFLENAKEYNCACTIIDSKLIASNVASVNKGEIFSFEEKYLEKEEKKSKKISKPLEKEIKGLAKKIYLALDCEGVVRIDFLVCDEKIYVNEVNTIPGSLSIHLFKEFSNREFVEKLIETAKQNFEEKKHLTFVFKSEALKLFKEEIVYAKSRK